jgi:hypothetical protein
VHDLFDVLGLPRNAPVGEIRRVCARRSRCSHPDFRAPSAVDGKPTSRHGAGDAGDLMPRDLAIDFVDVASLLDRIELAFFAQNR